MACPGLRLRAFKSAFKRFAAAMDRPNGIAASAGAADGFPAPMPVVQADAAEKASDIHADVAFRASIRAR